MKEPALTVELPFHIPSLRPRAEGLGSRLGGWVEAAAAAPRTMQRCTATNAANRVPTSGH